VASLTSDLDYPMVIVTAAHDGERSGCLIGFQTQCSINPPQWAVWVSKENHTHRVVRSAAVLAVHFPSVDDMDLARLFGEETGDEVDKFAQCTWRDGPDGVPLLERIENRIVGRVLDRVDAGGDHLCVLVDATDSTYEGPLRPLTFQRVRDFDPGHPA
jgi:flavin reductase (DIM6/NTAB) family NADH-FMN oxidoreductase RutF